MNFADKSPIFEFNKGRLQWGPSLGNVTSSFYFVDQKYTRARPQFTSRMGDRGVTITIPHGYSKNSLPNKTRTEVNVGMIANKYKLQQTTHFLTLIT